MREDIAGSDHPAPCRSLIRQQPADDLLPPLVLPQHQPYPLHVALIHNGRRHHRCIGRWGHRSNMHVCPSHQARAACVPKRTDRVGDLGCQLSSELLRRTLIILVHKNVEVHYDSLRALQADQLDPSGVDTLKAFGGGHKSIVVFIEGQADPDRSR
eukprot:768131-Hanusia_phi.AAC.8